MAGLCLFILPSKIRWGNTWGSGFQQSFLFQSVERTGEPREVVVTVEDWSKIFPTSEGKKKDQKLRFLLDIYNKTKKKKKIVSILVIFKFWG